MVRCACMVTAWALGFSNWKMCIRDSINVEPLITHTFGIGEMEQAIKMQMGGESIKVMVLPNKR